MEAWGRKSRTRPAAPSPWRTSGLRSRGVRTITGGGEKTGRPSAKSLNYGARARAQGRCEQQCVTREDPRSADRSPDMTVAGANPRPPESGDRLLSLLLRCRLTRREQQVVLVVLLADTPLTVMEVARPAR